MTLLEARVRWGVVPVPVFRALQAVESRTPKRVHFHAHTWNVMDEPDGLSASIKPIRDALVECGVIHSDAPNSGHEFVYSQEVKRDQRGVVIRVSPRRPDAEKER